MRLILKNLLSTILVPGTVAVYVPLSMSPAQPSLLAPLWSVERVLAVPFLLFGATICPRCPRDFAADGGGTRGPIDAPRRLVVWGFYRHVRNPMCVGVLATIAAWALFFSSVRILLCGIVVALVSHLFVVLYENPSLKRQFGGSHELHCREAGRWSPRLRIKRAQ